MRKKMTTIRLDSEDIEMAKQIGVNISKVAGEILKIEIEAWCESQDMESDSQKSQAKSRAYQRQLVSEYLKKRGTEKAQELRDMRAHIKAAKEANKTRGEAETAFGKLFPDHLWNEA